MKKYMVTINESLTDSRKQELLTQHIYVTYECSFLPGFLFIEASQSLAELQSISWFTSVEESVTGNLCK